MRKRLHLTLAMLACLAVALFSVAYPILVIQPFRHQGPRELAIALVVSQYRAIVAAVMAIAAVIALIAYWRAQPRKWWRALASAGAVLTIVLAFLARVNIYELMFHPDAQPSFSQAQETKLEPDEKVTAIKVGSQSRAYPIRSMSYHHVLNDVVGGLAVVATY